MKSILLIAVSLFSGCGFGSMHGYSKPCTIKGVQIELLDDIAVSNYCKSVLHSTRDDGSVHPNDRVLGCTSVDEKLMILGSDAGAMLHELRHLFDRYCKN